MESCPYTSRYFIHQTNANTLLSRWLTLWTLQIMTIIILLSNILININLY